MRFVVGPATVGDATEDLRNAPKAIKKGKRQLEDAKTELADAENDLARGEEGVGELRDGLLLAASGSRELASGAERAQLGTSELAAGADRAASGANQVAAGTNRAKTGSSSLLAGLDEAVDGAGRLRGGRYGGPPGFGALASGADQLSDRLNGELAPGADQLAAGLREGQAQLNALRVPAQITENQIAAAQQTLQSFTTGAADPLFPQALQQVTTALTAARGARTLRGPGCLDRPGGGAGRAGRRRSRLDRLRRARRGGRRQRHQRRRQRPLGRPTRPRIGRRRLRLGLARARKRVASSASGLDRLAAGAARLARGVGALSAGANQLDTGLGQIAAGNNQLAAGLEEGYGQTGELEAGLAEGHDEVAMLRMQLLTETGPFKSLRDLRELQRKSPGFFRSGFVSVAAVDGARPVPKENAHFLVDANRGGNVARLNALPDVPTNDPRTAMVVDNVREIVDDFEERTGTEAAAGGAAGQLVDYDRVTSGRIPILVIAISLVTYLFLVPILRSLFLPMIAVLLNLLTVAVGFGVLALLFVDDALGIFNEAPLGGAGALDVISVAGIFAITFALSIDYQVFLLTRMREEFVRTQSNEAAIEFGIEKTAKVVTGAAAIMVAVFVAFALSDFVIIKQFGVGLAVAVLIDATIVRLALLPSLMRLFGLNTWWIPTWLDERLPLLDVEGSEFEHETEQLGAQRREPPPPPAALGDLANWERGQGRYGASP